MHKRMDKAQQKNVAAETPSAYATQMSYDSIVHAPKALRFLIDIAGIENVHLGTDYSFPPADMEPDSVRNEKVKVLRSLRAFTRADLRGSSVNSPYLGRELPGEVRWTVFRGRPTVADGSLRPEMDAEVPA